MGLDWIVNSKEKLIVATAEGEFTARELHDYLVVIVGANAWSYRQLIDFSQSATALTLDEATELGAHIRMHHAQPDAGPLAVVLPRQQSAPIARVLGIMAVAQRPMRLFDKYEPAAKWLHDITPADTSSAIGPAPGDAPEPPCL